MSRTGNPEEYPFTFHGDLLGISSYYSIDQALAKKQLDTFYNFVFDEFKQPEVKVFLFSDSVFITGSALEQALRKLGEVYLKLFYENIFIKGALVKGALEFDPRLELEHIKKQLPSTDVLYRAVSLQKGVKGIRLLIEKDVAKDILPREWLTDHDYGNHVDLAGFKSSDFRRKIVLAREWNSY